MKQVRKKQALPIKRAITLIEMIVVMILIATITGAVAHNYRESLNEGRAFRTKEGIERIQTIISLYYAEHPEEMDAENKTNETFANIARQSPLVRDAQEFLRDGWGIPYKIEVAPSTTGDVQIAVTSDKYNKYKASKKTSAEQKNK